jgi:hypothetical protein|tara:strand:+ start:201 stop:743 length:543 start_codon:yes stop_codon:yes gene_type:complete
MGIHKSHSKSNMIYLFNQFGIELNNSQTKNELIQVIESLIKSKSITFKDNDFDIKNYGDLAIHLHNENKECKIDTIQKEIVMTKAKRIIQFGKCNYNIQATEYSSVDEIFSDCIYISKYGWIPSVRRACKIHNNCIFKIDHVNPVMPKKTLKEIANKSKLKRIKSYNCKITHGSFTIKFE